MSDMWFGLLCWLCIALLASVLIFRFMRVPDAEDGSDAKHEMTGLSMLPGYGWGANELDQARAGQAHPNTDTGRALQ